MTDNKISVWGKPIFRVNHPSTINTTATMSARPTIAPTADLFQNMKRAAKATTATAAKLVKDIL